MKKILIITGTYLPGKKAGGPIESVKNLILSFKDKFEFSLVTSNCDFGEEKPYENIETNKWYFKEGVKIKYYSKSFFNIKGILKILKEDSYDLIYLQSAFCFKYTILPLLVNKLYNLNKNFLVAPRGSFDQGALELKGTKKNIFLKIAKTLKIYENITWQATALEEKKNILKFFPNANVTIMSNLKEDKIIDKQNRKESKKLRLVHISRIHPKKNLIFFLRCLSKMEKEKLRNIELDIYGPIEDEEYWEKCIEIIRYNDLKCKYQGYIENKNVSLKISEYDFFILPTLGENFGHVIIESLIAKTPIIISNKTPWKDLENKNIGYDLDLAQEKWMDCLNKVYELNQKKYEDKINSIKLFLIEDYNLQNQKNKVLEILEKVTFISPN